MPCPKHAPGQLVPKQRDKRIRRKTVQLPVVDLVAHLQSYFEAWNATKKDSCCRFMACSWLFLEGCMLTSSETTY